MTVSFLKIGFISAKCSAFVHPQKLNGWRRRNESYNVYFFSVFIVISYKNLKYETGIA